MIFPLPFFLVNEIETMYIIQYCKSLEELSNKRYPNSDDLHVPRHDMHDYADKSMQNKKLHSC